MQASVVSRPSVVGRRLVRGVLIDATDHGQRTRSYLKNVFWPNLFVDTSFQVLEILEYSCGLKLGSAVTLNQNPIFEIASWEPHEHPRTPLK